MAFAPGSRLGPRVLVLAALGAAGIFCVPAGAQVVAAVPQAKVAVPQESSIHRLKALIEAGEKSAEGEDLDTASAKADEAEVLVADWSSEVLRRPDILPLIERLRALEQLFADDGDNDGLKMMEEVVVLSPAELKVERDHVLAAEQGAVFDFPIDLNDKVLTWVNIFTGRIKSKIEASLSRGSSYLPMIRQIFAEEGVPQDLAFLPIVESGYLNHARSYAKAVGMWQFMRATGRMFGLNGNAWIEERRDPVKATRAAARLLKRLYEREGDWYLALVGYNAGPLTTDRASQALGTRNFWDMARSRWLRDATKSYVPQMCAAVLVGRFPERYGLNIRQEAPYAYETVEVDRMTSLPVLARHAGTDVERLKELNPELLRATTPPGSYVLRVPPGTAQVTSRALAGIPSRERLDFKSYVIRKGDTLARVAARFKVGTEDLLLTNGLKPNQFKAGRRIHVPPPPTIPFKAADLKPAAVRAKQLSERPLEPLPAVPSAPIIESGLRPKVTEAGTVSAPSPAEVGKPATDLPPVPKEGVISGESIPEPTHPPITRAVAEPVRARVHHVKRGETLFSISQRYGVTLADLRKWNKLKGNRIQVGQSLRLQRP